MSQGSLISFLNIEIYSITLSTNMSGGRPPRGAQDVPNVEVHTLESSLGMLSPLATHQTGRPFFKSSRLKEILERPFDVIHYHNVSLVGGPDVLRFGRAVKFYTLHGSLK